MAQSNNNSESNNKSALGRLLPLLLLLFLLLAGYFWKQSQDLSKENQKLKQENAELKKKLDDIDSLTPTKDPITKEDIAKMQEKIIRPKKALGMYGKYEADRINLLSPILKKKYGKDFNDTRSLYFDYKVLKAYFKYIDEKSKQYKVKPEGIKIAFGVYKDSFPNQASVFLVPTTLKNKRQSAYDIIDKKVVYYSEIDRAVTVQKASFFNFSSLNVSAPGLTLSYGRPVPPPNNIDPL